MRHLALAGLVAAVFLAGCGKSESTSGSGGTSGGGSTGGGSASAKTPEQFFDSMKGAMIKGDSGALWGMFSSASHKWFVKSMAEMKDGMKDAPEEGLARTAERFGMKVDEFKAADPEKLAKAMLGAQSKDAKEKAKMEKTSFVKADVEGDKALCETKEADGSAEFVVLVKEGGDWKFDVEQSQEYDKKKKSSGK
jgi:hypothetical protein